MTTQMCIQNTPNLLTEDFGSRTSTPILDLFLQNREIVCLGEINPESTASLMLQLKQLEMLDPSAPITMYINSPGGSLNDALAVYDVMRSLTCPIDTVCVGTAASCATLLFVAGRERKMMPHSRLLIHDPYLAAGKAPGNAPAMATQLAELLKFKEEVARIIAANSNASVEDISSKMTEETVFDVYEAVKLGLATGGVGNKDDLDTIFLRNDNSPTQNDEHAESKPGGSDIDPSVASSRDNDRKDSHND